MRKNLVKTVLALIFALLVGTSFSYSQAGVPHHLTFIGQPPFAVTAGDVFQVRVEVRDEFDNLVTTASNNITLSQTGIPCFDPSVSPLTLSAVSGVATFPLVRFFAACSNYTLRATSSGLLEAVSSTFSVNPAAAAELIFFQQPVNTVVTRTMTAVIVRARDIFGNTVVSENRPITLSLSTNPGGATLSGTLTRNAVNGQATFIDLSLNVVANGYRLRATLASLPQANSNLFNITEASFDLSHWVIAGGGGSDSMGGTFPGILNVSGTVGQHVAGTASNSSPAQFDLHGGFWFQNLAPTAATVSITGRVTTANGQGIRGVRLTLTAPNGARRTATTSTFGYYAFDGVEVGHTYVLDIAAKRYTFANPTRIFSLQDHVSGMDFTAQPQ